MILPEDRIKRWADLTKAMILHGDANAAKYYARKAVGVARLHSVIVATALVGIE